MVIISSFILGACAPAAQPAPAAPAPAQTLTIYSGRAESLVKPIIEQFGNVAGVKVQVRYGGTAEMAAAILEEGKNSPADVFFAQDPGGLGAVDSLLMPLPDTILSLVPARFRSPKGTWVGISGRARVVVYNSQKLAENDLPDDIWDFTDPKWKNRMGWAPTNASFQAMVTAMRVLWGEEKTEQWLKGMQSNNPKVYPNNTAQVNAAGAGEIDVGFPNHYYLYGIMQEKGESFPARNYYMRGGGPGSVVLVAGTGILETSKNKEAAQRFMEFMLSPVAQQYFASQTFEYPVIAGVKTHRLLKPLAEVKSPDVDMPQMADVKGTVNLLRKVGIIP
ncbi:MAG: iron ABC transporter substrate-binding protein [Chloroflexi bacterium]|nr:iron ABC transporter substrate-binding protein [Chloroflexota bacterium]